MSKTHENIAATSALIQAICALLGLVVAVITLVFLIRYASDTREMTRISRQQFAFAQEQARESTQQTLAAVAAAQQQTSDADQALALSRKTFEADSAAYIHNFNAGVSSSSFLIAFSSTGKAAPRDIRGTWRVTTRSLNTRSQIFDLSQPFAIQSLFPGQQQNVRIPGYLDQDEAARRNAVTLIQLKYSYDNGFGRRLVGSFCAVRFIHVNGNLPLMENMPACDQIRDYDPVYASLFADILHTRH